MSNFYTQDGAAFASEKMDWETPQSLFDELDSLHHFTLDPASTDANAKCENHYTIREDGLIQSWKGERVFCNPPYGRGIGKWVEKCWEESKHADIVLLIPARTDTSYFHDFIYHKAEIEFLRGRLKFEVNGKALNSAPFPSIIVTYPRRTDERYV